MAKRVFELLDKKKMNVQNLYLPYTLNIFILIGIVFGGVHGVCALQKNLVFKKV